MIEKMIKTGHFVVKPEEEVNDRFKVCIFRGKHLKWVGKEMSGSVKPEEIIPHKEVIHCTKVEDVGDGNKNKNTENAGLPGKGVDVVSI